MAAAFSHCLKAKCSGPLHQTRQFAMHPNASIISAVCLMLIQLLIQLCVSVAGLLDTQMQKVARVKAPKVVIHDDNYCIEDKM